MIATSDHSTSGHIGYCFEVSEGTHKQVARGLAEMISATRVCFGCLEGVWREGMSAAEAANTTFGWANTWPEPPAVAPRRRPPRPPPAAVAPWRCGGGARGARAAAGRQMRCATSHSIPT